MTISVKKMQQKRKMKIQVHQVINHMFSYVVQLSIQARTKVMQFTCCDALFLSISNLLTVWVEFETLALTLLNARKTYNQSWFFKKIQNLLNLDSFFEVYIFVIYDLVFEALLFIIRKLSEEIF